MLTAMTTSPSLWSRLIDGVARLQEHLDLALELRRLDPEKARRVLEERGMIDGPHWQVPARSRIAVRALSRLMRAIGLEPAAIAQKAPAQMRDMQRACAGCGVRSRCEREMESGQIRATYQSFCPNAERLDAFRRDRIPVSA